MSEPDVSDVAPAEQSTSSVAAPAPARAPLADLTDDWHALAWRPAGSMSLAQRWLSAGAPFPPAPATQGRRSKRRR
jgi:hypothetical protein